MYLHLGNNRNVRKRDIVGIFDADSATVTLSAKRFLSHAQKQGKLISVTYDIPKSFVVMRDGTVYMCQISSSSLKGRAEQQYPE